MRIGRTIEWSESRGRPVTVGDTTVTPVARSLAVRCSRLGAVWSDPAAILVERDGRTDRIPIMNVNRRIVWGLRLGAVALIAGWMAHRGRRD